MALFKITCSGCGKSVSVLSSYYLDNDKNELCKDCFKKYEDEQKLKENPEKEKHSTKLSEEEYKKASKTFDSPIKSIDFLFEVIGYNGKVGVYTNKIVITRKGLFTSLLQGLKGEKTIPIKNITSVQFKKPGFSTGYIQFAVKGSIEASGGVMSAIHDENTVTFKKDTDKFIKLKDFIESKIQDSGSISNVKTALDILKERFARDEITEEEFLKKKELLQ